MKNNVSKYLLNENLSFILNNFKPNWLINCIKLSLEGTSFKQDFVKKLYKETYFSIELSHNPNAKNKKITPFLSRQYDFQIKNETNSDLSTVYYLQCIFFECSYTFNSVERFYSYTELLNYIQTDILNHILNANKSTAQQINTILINDKVNLF